MRNLLLLSVMFFSQLVFAQSYSQELVTKAKDGDKKAQRDLGNAYMSGDNVQKNVREGLFWIKKSATQGYGLACTDMGYCYSEGIGVEKDLVKAFEWYKKGADLGDPEAQFYTGVAYEHGEGISQDYVKARFWYQKAAMNNNRGAQYNLGFLCAEGLGGSQDYKSAVEWYTKAANQGLDYAQINLGICYYLGNGVNKDVSKAKYWMQKAASQGNEIAYYNLGNYCIDEETKESYLSAIRYYEKAAQLGHEKAAWNLPIAQTHLAQIYGNEDNWDEVFRLLKLAVENKTNAPVGAMRGIAYLYQCYDKVKDLEKSKYWTQRAENEKAQNGNVSMEYK